MGAPGVFKEARKIAVMEEMLSQIKNGQFDHPYDVELLLYHDHPLLAAYGQWEQDGPCIGFTVNESVNGFLAKTRNQLAETDRAITMAAGAARDTGAEDTRGLDDDLDR